ncbi:MAG: GTP 3',8-cyclase MoaA [Candidatus Tectomicrobia bacterium]|uniref:GTP 3',8-cyclase n=1 Tax=Tectimicrobiota bacterium TaxID=2528274 RepID=A0A932GRV8_UNCTE|nr:GTP 3',8-cyclase MoaA [Candidatus Tectomicrobia bacterium]
MAKVRDLYNRPVKDLRISVTDRCNFRCTYCMPLDEYVWIDKKEILTFEEITRLANLFIQLGVDKIRLTGGEPLVRRDLEKLICQLSSLNGLNDLSLTTNGSVLAEKAPALKSAGLKRINVSIDTLDPEKFKRITKRGDLARVLEGLFTAQRCGLNPIKINAVIERGVNDDEIIDLVDFSRKNGFAIRFIEYMDVGNSNNWTSEKMVSKKEIIERIKTRFPLREMGRNRGSAPSVDYQFMDGSGDIGVIASVTEPFCSSCTRVRLTADGKFVTCLFSQQGIDLKTPMRNGATDETLAEVIAATWRQRRDRYSDERLEALLSPTGYDPKRRQKIEMITLGG